MAYYITRPFFFISDPTYRNSHGLLFDRLIKLIFFETHLNLWWRVHIFSPVTSSPELRNCWRLLEVPNFRVCKIILILSSRVKVWRLTNYSYFVSYLSSLWFLFCKVCTALVISLVSVQLTLFWEWWCMASITGILRLKLQSTRCKSCLYTSLFTHGNLVIKEMERKANKSDVLYLFR